MPIDASALPAAGRRTQAADSLEIPRRIGARGAASLEISRRTAPGGGESSQQGETAHSLTAFLLLIFNPKKRSK